MKKQLFLAAISVALMAAPYAEAGSGFSRGSSSKSSSSSSSSSSTRSSSSGSSSGSSAPAARNYGSALSFGSSRKADTPRATTPSYVPQYHATPVAAAAPAPAAAPKSSGFSSAATATTSRKVAAVAGGTALGGALYAAQANHDAVAAYDRSQRPAPSPSVASASPNYAPRPTIASTSGYQVPQQQTHVVVVHEEPHHHYYSQPDPTTAYVAGMLAGERHARYQDRDRGYYGSPAQATAPSVANTTTSPAAVPNSQSASPVVVTRAAPEQRESHTGLVIFLVLLALGAGGLYAYYALRIKRGPKAPNYTL